MKLHQRQTTTTGIHVRGGDLTVNNCRVSNQGGPTSGISAHAAIVLEGTGDLTVRDTICYDSQRAVLAYDHRDPTAGKTSVDLRGVHAVGYQQVLPTEAQESNKRESFLIHGRPGPSAGYDLIAVRNCSTDRSLQSALTLWCVEAEQVIITNFRGPEMIDIAVDRPIRGLFIRDIDITRVVVRIMDGFAADDIGNWSLDNAYTYTLVDARGGTGATWTDDIVGEFDRPSDILDWWSDQQ